MASGFQTLLPVKKVLKPYEAHEKTFYPFTVKGLIKADGKDMIFNASEPIPEKCECVECTCYLWFEDGKNRIKFKNYKPR